ncbi:MAG TPA: DUF167 domain-containing protein [Rhodospirillaceae bacterium]|nr:DUF167 domain-containing protein [Rhodospirillaceae bacterium]
MPFTPTAGGVRLTVRLTPKASRNRIEGVVAEADGSASLKVSVTAVPEAGKANAALIALLAKSWRMAKRDFEIVAGATDRRKTVVVATEAAEMTRLIADLTRKP